MDGGDEGQKYRAEVHRQLLIGLADENAAIRANLFKFWDDPAHLSDAVVSNIVCSLPLSAINN